MPKPRTSILFKSVKDRDKTIKHYPKNTYEIDKGNPLKVYLNF